MTVKGILKNPSPTHSLWTSGWFEFSPEERISNIRKRVHFMDEVKIKPSPVEYILVHISRVEDSDSE